MSEQKTPAIRFDGFKQEWKPEQLGERGRAVSGVGFPERLQGGRRGVPFFKVSDMNSDGNESVMHSAMNYVSDENIRDMGWSVIQAESVFFAKVGAAVMKDRKRLVSPPFLMDNNTMAYVFDPSFWSNPFILYRFAQIDLTKLVQVGALPSYNGSQIEGIKTHVPSLDEQQAIGAFFSVLDLTLDSGVKKLEKLRALKQTMLVKMFPQSDARVPEIRFDGFDQDWDEATLESLGHIKTGPFGSTLHAADYVDSGTPIITTEHFKSGRIAPFSASLPLVSADDWQRLRAYSLQTGDIVFSRVGSVDLNAEVEPSNAGWLFSGRVLRLRLEETNATFAHYALSTHAVRGDILSRAVGQTMPSINTKILGETRLPLPDEKEQEAIGTYFRELDALIDTESQKLEKLRHLKSSFLRSMFV